MQNRKIVLASRPEGEPSEDNFRLETDSIPEPGRNQLLVRNQYLSIDPYMRGRMSDRPSYAKPVRLGEVMIGGTVGKVIASNIAGYSVGDSVVGYGGWQDYAVFDAHDRQLLRVPPGITDSSALGVAGMTGATAYFGMTKIGRPNPGETVVISAASGAVGSVAGQIARMFGCYTVGIAGGPAKCAYVTGELGLDACVDHRSPNMAAELAEACPKGIDVYFENVGGKVLDAVIKLLNPQARIPICGFISQYNDPDPVSPSDVLDALPTPPFHQFFVVWNWPAEYPAAIAQLAQWVREGKLRYREDVTVGLENAPRALIGVLRGENFGKKIIRIDAPD